MPGCAPATIAAIDAIARASAPGQGVNLALAGASDERMGYMVNYIVDAICEDWTLAERELSSCEPEIVDPR